MDINQLLQTLKERNGSDLHLKVGVPPGIRKDGMLKPLEGLDVLKPADTRKLLEQILKPEQLSTFDNEGDLDFGYTLPGVARFRINCLHQRNSCGMVIRAIPMDILTLDDINAPEALKRLCSLPRGLVLVTGPTGSGKSTTLSAMIDYINQNNQEHILTLEDPIEFLHNDKQSYVNQREVGADTPSFAEGLRRALRQDPDVILIGEMRDLDTISLAITAAETGHLVFGTLHTTGAIQTIDRVIDVFPAGQQAQIRMQLSMGLGAVISQCLVPKIGGGRVCAMEIMIATDAIKSLIREGKTQMMGNILQTSAKQGMQTLDSELVKYVKQLIITPEDAIAKAQNPQAFQAMIGSGGLINQQAGIGQLTGQLK
ncbi:MAG: type IV pilus twitching motility protein PilT [candidate division Zixibacteria bacterium]|nr:type IV pilus twitching motility protein PilT [candidate division Zixibacteria bacterium]